MTIELYAVGGYVRDSLLGIDSKDIDFTAIAPSFDAMREFLVDCGFEIFLETPEYLTIRARFPRYYVDERLPKRFVHAKNLPTADFVLARKEGAYSDGRRPDAVEVGTLLDDLKRRDFTMNAIAMDKDDNLIDPFNGKRDILWRRIKCVGNAEDRIREDALRALRAIRFSITKKFVVDADIIGALHSDWLPPLLSTVSAERRREELDKCFKVNTLETLDWFAYLPVSFKEAVFTDGLRLKPTMEA